MNIQNTTISNGETASEFGFSVTPRKAKPAPGPEPKPGILFPKTEAEYAAHIRKHNGITSHSKPKLPPSPNNTGGRPKEVSHSSKFRDAIQAHPGSSALQVSQLTGMDLEQIKHAIANIRRYDTRGFITSELRVPEGENRRQAFYTYTYRG